MSESVKWTFQFASSQRFEREQFVAEQGWHAIDPGSLESRR